MSKIVNVFSRVLVLEIEPTPDTCLVSISSPKFEYAREINANGWKDVIQLEFDDTIPEIAAFEKKSRGITESVFTMEQAKNLLSFIERNNGSAFIVHCDAGISRSVAVGSFMRDFFDYSPWFQRTIHDGFRNIYVYDLLRRAARNIKE